ncbi:uncharacterized protein B0H18DRAFT_113475 [Fomitopsis serialis]|uniref:uncharacterized protein n=1 Tax=Fomitopsis serialis TaxID=139415 RepID=UPI0020084D67|nr:uncharacterized protein B0H18DRAFT_113475 [Neoantrodia serialis]KAH9914984.1 hypothetical protein B0H18DRAFT_113475 [Neoantrodia serialis]
MIGILLPHPSLASGSVDTYYQQSHQDNEDATYLLESCETGSTDTLVEGAIGGHSMQQPSKWTSLSNVFLQKWPSLHFTAPQIPSVHSKKAMTLLVDYTLQCIFYAAVFAAYAGASTFLGLVPLAFIPEEPYAGDANVIFLGALGGSILSVGFTTVHWGFYRLEELYEAAYGIYQEPSRRYRWQHETETNDPPPPELACRYGSTVFFHSVVAGLLTSGLLGPVVGTAILIQHGVMDGTLTLVQAMICGGVGTGVVFAILLIGVAVMHVTWDW